MITSNPLLDFSGLPRYAEILPAHVTPAMDQLLAQAAAAVAQAERATDVGWATFAPLKESHERLGRAWGQVSHLQSVADTPALRQAYNANLPRIAQFEAALAQNLALYEQYLRIEAAPEFPHFSPARKRVVDKVLRDFRLGGAVLAAGDKARFAEIQAALSALSSRFGQNVLDATDACTHHVDDEAGVAGLPEEAKSAARARAQAVGKPGWLFNLQGPSLNAVLQYADQRALRETLYRAHATRASEFGPAATDNTPLIAQIVALRKEAAGLLGFANYGEYSLATKMADSPDQVLGFLRDLSARAMPHARTDRAQLAAFANEELGIAELQVWDVAYVSEKLKQARYAFSAQEVKQFFSQERVLAGLFGVIEELYGFKTERDRASVWHEDVRFYRLVDSTGRSVGQFYLDLYAREGKRGGAWMDSCRNRRVTGKDVQTPVVLLTCNFGRGVDGKPALFDHGEVITLFHEMGHGLHQLLTEVDEPEVAGLNGVEWDAVELPSQFMENFCWEWPRIAAMSGHAGTGEPLPRALYERMLAARNFQSGTVTMRQIEFSLFDMLLHSSFDAESDSLQALAARVREEATVHLPPAYNRFAHGFMHIFSGGYAAGYYSYKWAEVMSADAYAALEEAPDQLRQVGERFRRDVLAVGGSRPALDSFTAFRGRAPHKDALLRHLGMAGA